VSGILADAPVRLSDEEALARFQRPDRHPKGSQLLGFRMLRVDQANMTVEVAFEGREDFTNPMGQIQGGFVTAMLDECMSVVGVLASNFTCVMPTLEMKTSFLRPALPGPLRGVGRVVKWGRSVAFTAGELYDGEGRLLATATGTALPTPRSAKTKG
jgi:uncharacterized protein (TIGR00369 family)